MTFLAFKVLKYRIVGWEYIALKSIVINSPGRPAYMVLSTSYVVQVNTEIVLMNTTEVLVNTTVVTINLKLVLLKQQSNENK